MNLEGKNTYRTGTKDRAGSRWTQARMGARRALLRPSSSRRALHEKASKSTVLPHVVLNDLHCAPMHRSHPMIPTQNSVPRWSCGAPLDDAIAALYFLKW